MLAKQINYRSVVKPFGVKQKLSSALLSGLLISAAPAVIGCSQSESQDYPWQSFINSNSSPTIPIDQPVNYIYPVPKITLASLATGEVLTDTSALGQYAVYKYTHTKNTFKVSWELNSNTKTVKEYYYSVDGLNDTGWINNGLNTTFDIDQPLSAGQHTIRVKVKYTDDKIVGPVELTFSVVEKMTFGQETTAPKDEEFRKIIKTSDGGFLALGLQKSFYYKNENTLAEHNGFLVNKYDVNKQLVWSKTYEGSDGWWDSINYTQDGQGMEDADGNYLFFMMNYSTDGIFSGNLGNTDLALLKVNKTTGEIMFITKFGTIGSDTSWQLIQASDGSYVCIGTADAYFYFVKVDNAGNILVNNKTTELIRGAMNIIKQNDGLLVYSLGPQNIGNYLRAIIVHKIDWNGNVLSKKELGYAVYLEGVKQLSSGNIILFGSTNDPAHFGVTSTDFNFWLMEVDPDGNVLSEKQYGGTSNDDLYNVMEKPDGTLVLFGTTWSNNYDVAGNHGRTDLWVGELDVAKNLTSQICIGFQYDENNAFVPQALLDTDGSVYVLGSTNSGGKVYITKVSSGTLLWQKIIEPSAANKAITFTLVKDNDGNILLPGYCLGDYGKNGYILKINKATGEPMN